MRFEKLEQLVKELERLTGNKWIIAPTSLAEDENSMTYIDDGTTFEDTYLRNYGNLPQRQPLSMEDLKTFFSLTPRKKMQYIKLVQDIILIETDSKTNKRDMKFKLKREFPLSTELDDGTTIADNLQNFAWSYRWTNHSVSGVHFIPSNGNVTMSGDINDKILNFIQQQKISSEQLTPLTHHRDKFMQLLGLAKQAVKNLNQEDEQ